METRNRPVLHWYVFAVCIMAAASLLSASWAIPDDQLAFRNGLTAFIILGLLSEAGFLRLGISTAGSSVAFIPYLAAIVLYSPAWAMSVSGVTLLVAETLLRRKPAIKVLHNASKEIVAVGLAALVYGLVGGVPQSV